MLAAYMRYMLTVSEELRVSDKEVVMKKPLTYAELESIGSIEADPPSEATIEVILAESQSETADEVTVQRLEHGVRVVRRVGIEGLPDIRQRRRPNTVELSRYGLDTSTPSVDLPGYRPGGLKTEFSPLRAPHECPDVPNGDGPTTRERSIFDNDDRVLFQDANYPWRITGKVATARGFGSGTVIGPRHVLTASHVVDWRRDAQGNIGWINFTPASYDGRGPWGTFYADTVVSWVENPLNINDDQTAFDYSVLVFSERIGDVVGFAGFRTYDASWNGGSYWQSIGYPADLQRGERPAFEGNGAVRTISEHSNSGRTGYVMGHCKDFTPGQSGGPAWGFWNGESWPTVVGVGSTIGDTVVKQSSTATTRNDNEFGGGPALSVLIDWSRKNHP